MSHRVIVITDLDGTLLDHQTYDYSPAKAALTRLKEKDVPLILCSSKTAAEMIFLRKEIHNTDPFIVENGGGIYIPKSYFSNVPASTLYKNNSLVIPLGRPYDELKRVLDDIAAEYGLTIEGFHQISAVQLAHQSKLPLDQAERSLKREFDLPFRIVKGAHHLASVKEAVHQRGLRLAKGGRFLHLAGENDKGVAAGHLIKLYQTNSKTPVQTIGLGDSQNDLSLLRVVDIPVVIPNPYSSAPLLDELPGARKAADAGPAGWNDVVLSLLEDIT
jgi:mannosyl-3-phosphoglycerate phosphatase